MNQRLIDLHIAKALMQCAIEKFREADEENLADDLYGKMYWIDKAIEQETENPN